MAVAVWTFGRRVVQTLVHPIYMIGVRFVQMKNWCYLWFANWLGLPHQESPFPTIRTFLYQQTVAACQNSRVLLGYLATRSRQLGPVGVVRSSLRNTLRLVMYVLYGLVVRLPVYLLYSQLYLSAVRGVKFVGSHVAIQSRVRQAGWAVACLVAVQFVLCLFYLFLVFGLCLLVAATVFWLYGRRQMFVRFLLASRPSFANHHQRFFR